MQITIDDSLSGEERKRLLRLEPVKYALELFKGNRTHTSKWLGISERTLRNYLLEDAELFRYKKMQNFIAPYVKDPESLLSDDERYYYNKELEQIKNKPGWTHVDGTRRNFLIRKLVYKHLKEK